VTAWQRAREIVPWAIAVLIVRGVGVLIVYSTYFSARNA
jgi:hypothetical protein